MLIIEVTNAREVVRQRIGRLGARLIGKVVDAEQQVEEALGLSTLTDMRQQVVPGLAEQGHARPE